jgi:hypothetical protein
MYNQRMIGLNYCIPCMAPNFVFYWEVNCYRFHSNTCNIFRSTSRYNGLRYHNAYCYTVSEEINQKHWKAGTIYSRDKSVIGNK